MPSAKAIGFLVNTNFPPSVDQISAAESAVRTIGVGIRVLRANNEREIEAAFETIAKENIRALAVASSPYFDGHRSLIIALAARHAVPTIYHFREYTTAGGLISYGIDIVEAYRQVALYVSQILNGTKPGDLPILRPTKFDLVINRAQDGGKPVIKPNKQKTIGIVQVQSLRHSPAEHIDLLS